MSEQQPGPGARPGAWWTLLSEMLPERWLVDVTAVPGGSGTLLRWTFVRGGYDGALARCAPRLVDDAVGRLRALGVEVTVGEWESSVPSR